MSHSVSARDTKELPTRRAQYSTTGRARYGFTMVELLVATVVMSFTLLGVYTVFRQSLLVEESVTSSWRERSEASVVAEYFVNYLQRAVQLDNYPLIQGGPMENKRGYELIFTASGSTPNPSEPTRAALQRCRFTWGGEEEFEGVLTVQVIPLAGTTDLGLSAAAQGQAFDDMQRWALTPTVVIADGIDDISIDYRPADDPAADWTNRWQSEDTTPLIRVRVVRGLYTTERHVVPRVTQALTPGSEG